MARGHVAARLSRPANSRADTNGCMVGGLRTIDQDDFRLSAPCRLPVRQRIRGCQHSSDVDRQLRETVGIRTRAVGCQRVRRKIRDADLEGRGGSDGAMSVIGARASGRPDRRIAVPGIAAGRGAGDRGPTRWASEWPRPWPRNGVEGGVAGGGAVLAAWQPGGRPVMSGRRAADAPTTQRRRRPGEHTEPGRHGRPTRRIRGGRCATSTAAWATTVRSSTGCRPLRRSSRSGCWFESVVERGRHPAGQGRWAERVRRADRLQRSRARTAVGHVRASSANRRWSPVLSRRRG